MHAKELVAHMDATFQTCTACGETKSLHHFYKQKNNPDGTRNWSLRCKVCTSSRVTKVLATPEVQGPFIEVTVPLNQRTRWTAQDDAYLRANPHELTEVLAKVLCRTIYAVDHRRAMLRNGQVQ